MGYAPSNAFSGTTSTPFGLPAPQAKVLDTNSNDTQSDSVDDRLTGFSDNMHGLPQAQAKLIAQKRPNMHRLESVRPKETRTKSQSVTDTAVPGFRTPLGTRLGDRRLGSLEASDDLSVVQECFVGAFLLLLMFMVYLFTRRITAPNEFGPNGTRIVRKKAPT